MSKIVPDTIIVMAEKYLGTKEVPANSNNVIFNTHFYGKEVSGSAYPWCAAFIWDIFRLCGASDLFCGGQKVAYCPDIENYYKKHGQWHTTGQRGDIVLMDFGKGRASHTGILLCKQDGYYITIEGNTSTSSNDNGGAVMKRRRSKSVIRGFARPDYTKSKNVKTSSTSATSSAENKYGVVHTKLSPLRMRTSNSLQADVICKIPKGTLVKIVSKGKEWTKVEYGGNVGYCSTKYLKFD